MAVKSEPADNVTASDLPFTFHLRPPRVKHPAAPEDRKEASMFRTSTHRWLPKGMDVKPYDYQPISNDSRKRGAPCGGSDTVDDREEGHFKRHNHAECDTSAMFGMFASESPGSAAAVLREELTVPAKDMEALISAVVIDAYDKRSKHRQLVAGMSTKLAERRQTIQAHKSISTRLQQEKLGLEEALLKSESEKQMLAQQVEHLQAQLDERDQACVQTKQELAKQSETFSSWAEELRCKAVGLPNGQIVKNHAEMADEYATVDAKLISVGKKIDAVAGDNVALDKALQILRHDSQAHLMHCQHGVANRLAEENACLRADIKDMCNTSQAQISQLESTAEKDRLLLSREVKELNKKLVEADQAYTTERQDNKDLVSQVGTFMGFVEQLREQAAGLPVKVDAESVRLMGADATVEAKLSFISNGMETMTCSYLTLQIEIVDLNQSKMQFELAAIEAERKSKKLTEENTSLRQKNQQLERLISAFRKRESVQKEMEDLRKARKTDPTPFKIGGASKKQPRDHRSHLPSENMRLKGESERFQGDRKLLEPKVEDLRNSNQVKPIQLGEDAAEGIGKENAPSLKEIGNLRNTTKESISAHKNGLLPNGAQFRLLSSPDHTLYWLQSEAKAKVEFEIRCGRLTADNQRLKKDLECLHAKISGHSNQPAGQPTGELSGTPTSMAPDHSQSMASVVSVTQQRRDLPLDLQKQPSLHLKSTKPTKKPIGIWKARERQKEPASTKLATLISEKAAKLDPNVKKYVPAASASRELDWDPDYRNGVFKGARVGHSGPHDLRVRRVVGLFKSKQYATLISEGFVDMESHNERRTAYVRFSARINKLPTQPTIAGMIMSVVTMDDLTPGCRQRLLTPFNNEDGDADLYIQQCHLVQWPEVQMLAAQTFLDSEDNHEAYERFVAKMRSVHGVIGPEAIENWDQIEPSVQKAAEELAKIPQFRETCHAWMNAEAAEDDLCWPASFTHPNIIKLTSFQPDVDIRVAAEKLMSSDTMVDDLADRVSNAAEIDVMATDKIMQSVGDSQVSEGFVIETPPDNGAFDVKDEDMEVNENDAVQVKEEDMAVDDDDEDEEL